MTATQPREPRADDDVPTVSPDVMLFIGRPFTSAEALSVGISARALRRLEREGTIRRLFPGVYVDAAAPDTIELRAAALFEVVEDHAVICDRSAAWLHGVDILGPEGRSVVPPLEVYRTDGKNRVRRRECHGGKRTLVDRDVQSIRGMVVTTPLRTALDVGRLLPRADALGAVDALLHAARLTPHDMDRELPRFKGARGVIQLRGIVTLCNPEAESMAESRLRLQLLDAGLPPPEVQWKIRNARGHVVYRIDLAYPELRLAIEYDGRDFHSSPADVQRDAKRREHLARMGWTVVVLKAADVYGPQPRAVSKVREALGALGAAT